MKNYIARFGMGMGEEFKIDEDGGLYCTDTDGEAYPGGLDDALEYVNYAYKNWVAAKDRTPCDLSDEEAYAERHRDYNRTRQDYHDCVIKLKQLRILCKIEDSTVRREAIESVFDPHSILQGYLGYV